VANREFNESTVLARILMAAVRGPANPLRRRTVTEAPIDSLAERGLELVASDLEARGWLVERPLGPGMPRVRASRSQGRRVVYVACSRYPEAPSALVAEPLRLDEGEPWLARVQLSRRLAPMLAPQYVRLPPLALREAATSIMASWPPAPTAGLTF
jgi:hypothetical protein